MIRKLVAVTGASGFIGQNLLPVLSERGYRVRAITRLAEASGNGMVETAKADLLDLASLRPALKGVNTAYYLVHSMKAGSRFAELDEEAAANFLDASEEAGVERIIYLGGLGETGPGLSEHLASRAKVATILSSGRVPATTLRAAIILGSGGASWTMLKQLVERLPLMVTPKWVETRCQPIALRDVLEYLVRSNEVESTTGVSFDIGGPDIVTYREMMTRLAKALKKRLYIIGIPFLTPRLSSYWVRLVTDVPSSVARPLVEGLRNEVVCRENKLRELIPIQLTPYDQAIELALEKRV